MGDVMNKEKLYFEFGMSDRLAREDKNDARSANGKLARFGFWWFYLWPRIRFDSAPWAWFEVNLFCFRFEIGRM